MQARLSSAGAKMRNTLQAQLPSDGAEILNSCATL
jgi:hypothetical protein